MKTLSAYFEPRKNVVFERHSFRQATQQTDETVDEYCTRLRTLASSCEFGEQTDDHIRDQIVDKCTSTSLRRRLLRTENLQLEDLLPIARASESADKQAAETSQSFSSENVNAIRGQARRPFRLGNRDRNREHQQSASTDTICENCGIRGHLPRERPCPARNRDCDACGNVGHFARVCRTQRSGGLRPINQIETDCMTDTDCEEEFENNHKNGAAVDRDDDDVMFSVRTSGNTVLPTPVQVNNIPLNVIVDSGSSVDIIDEYAYRWMRSRSSALRLTPCRAKVFPYGSHRPIPLLGQVIAKVSTSSSSTATRLLVTQNGNGCIIGRKTATKLQLLHIEIKQHSGIRRPREVPVRLASSGSLMRSRTSTRRRKRIAPRRENAYMMMITMDGLPSEGGGGGGGEVERNIRKHD